MTGETKTEAIRKALVERRRQLKRPQANQRQHVIEFLERKVWATVPKKHLGKRLTRAEEDQIPRLRTRGRMTIDSSALLAILLGEPGALDLVDLILEADTARVGTPTLVETAIVLGSRRGKPSMREVVELIEELGVTMVPFDGMQMEAAVDAFERYGRGRHRAGLNFWRLPVIRDGGNGSRLVVVRRQ